MPSESSPPPSESADPPTDAESSEPAETDPTELPPPSLAPPGTHFEEILIPGLEAVRMRPGAFDGSNVGTGAALVDLDGDGRLDLFFGADGGGLHEACVYLNRSTAEGPRFEALDGVCGSLPPMVTGMVDPRPMSGGQGLLLAGTNAAYHLSLDGSSEPVLRTVFTLPSFDTAPEQSCVAASLLVADLALTGTPYLVVGCRSGAQSRLLDGVMNANNRVLRLAPDNETLIEPPAGASWLSDGGSTLALAQVDIRNDGLPDILLINDTFSTVNNRNTLHSPGGALLRCPPGIGCVWENFLFAPDVSAWGSLMGAGEVRIGATRFWYLTDWGPNRLLRWLGDRFSDQAAIRGALLDRGVPVDQEGAFPIFGWSALVDDFTGNGLDDIFVTNGSPRASHLDDAQHRDVLLAQRPDGTFETLDQEAGLPPPSEHRSTLPGFLNSSRGAMKADLTLDGRLEIIVLDDRGAPRFLRERRNPALPPRCNVDPLERHTVNVGTGYAFAPEGSRDFRTWDIQGQMLFGAPSRLVLPHQRGVLRFPSGAEIPYDCGGTPGPVRVEEPEWLRLTRTSDGVVLLAEAPWLFMEADTPVAVSLHALVDDPADPFSLVLVDEQEQNLDAASLASGWAVSLPQGTDTVMVRFGERWVPHRFRLDTLPPAR